VKRVKESRERIKLSRDEVSVMSAKYQQLVDRISQLDAAIQLKTTALEQVT